MEWLYLLLVFCILLVLCLFLRPSNIQIREKTGTFDFGDLNSLAWQNRGDTRCWDGPNSQGCTVPHQIYW